MKKSFLPEGFRPAGLYGKKFESLGLADEIFFILTALPYASFFDKGEV